MRPAPAAPSPAPSADRPGPRRASFAPPATHRPTPSRRAQPRDQPGTGRRGLARPAPSDDQQESRVALRRRRQPPPALVDRAGAAEEYRRVLGFERRQSRKRRTLFLRPGDPRAEQTLRLKPLPQQQ